MFTHTTQCVRGVLDPPVSAFSLSLYRHPFIYTLFSSRFTLIINNNIPCPELYPFISPHVSRVLPLRVTRLSPYPWVYMFSGHFNPRFLLFRYHSTNKQNTVHKRISLFRRTCPQSCLMVQDNGMTWWSGLITGMSRSPGLSISDTPSHFLWVWKSPSLKKCQDFRSSSFSF
jgi:hypothetical protein